MYKKFYGNFVPGWIPTRLLIALMTLTACWTSYMCRLQMPILAVPMIKAMPSNFTVGVCAYPDRAKRSATWYDPNSFVEDLILNERIAMAEAEETGNFVASRLRRELKYGEAREPDAPIELFNGLPFDWTPAIRGQVIAAYSYGNVPGNFVGGVVAMKFGPRRAILWTSILAATISLISPLLAQLHWGALAFSRVIVGLTGGITFPACHTLVAKWAPPDEKARFVWSLLGGTFGTIITYPMVASIADYINWESAWYIPSLLMFFWCAVWALIAYDSPAEHPGITEKERDYIITAQQGTVRKQKPSLKETPYKQIFTSVPFICLIFCHFGNLFLLFFYQNSLMLYLTKALGFQLTKGGAVAGLPWGGRMLFGFFFSWAGDTIMRRKLLSVTHLRKVATIFSHLVPGLFLIFVGYVGCSFVLANVFLFLALAFNGAAAVANLSNNQDLSPNFAGFLYGIMNTIGCTAGMIISPMVEEVAGKYGNPIHKWQILFWIGATVTISCMVIFIFGGSGEIQPWNELARKSEDETAEEGASQAESASPEEGKT